jgi:hypothetical protein
MNTMVRVSHVAAVVLLVAVLGWARQADASVFDFSYELSGGDIISGQFDGTIDSGDSNVLLVNSVVSASFNGAPGPALPYVDSFSNVGASTGAPAAVSFDGTLMDLVAATSSSVSDGILFCPDAAGFCPGGPAVNSGASFGGANEAFNAANWSLTEVSSVPLPATLPLFATALGILGLFGWRRRTAQLGLQPAS